MQQVSICSNYSEIHSLQGFRTLGLYMLCAKIFINYTFAFTLAFTIKFLIKQHFSALFIRGLSYFIMLFTILVKYTVALVYTISVITLWTTILFKIFKEVMKFRIGFRICNFFMPRFNISYQKFISISQITIKIIVSSFIRMMYKC